MLNVLITILVILIVLYMAHKESKFLFDPPSGCKSKPATIESAKSALNKAVKTVKQETRKIQMMMKKSAPKAVNISNPIEHVKASTTVVLGSNAIENVIDENLPYAEFGGLPKVQKATRGLIEGVRPPTYADPRTMNPSLAAAPVQFSDPAEFGAFGVTDQVSTAFSPDTDAEIASKRTLEGFEVAPNVYDANGAVLIKDGRIVKSASELPSAQIRGAIPHTTLPMRNLHNPPPVVEDLVESETFDGLEGYPVDEQLDPLTPPGLATPMSEWAKINYNV